MRRCPFSTITMPTSRMRNRKISGISSPQPRVALICANCDGMLDTTLAKISNDMPLPMPRWVMVSPSHMSRAVPAVSTSTTRITRGAVKSGRTSTFVGLLAPPSRPPPPLWNRNASAVDWRTAMAMVR